MPQEVSQSSHIHPDIGTVDAQRGNGKPRQPLPNGRIEGGMLKFPPRVRKRKKKRKGKANDHEAIDRAQFRTDFLVETSLRRLFASRKISLIPGGL